MSKRSAIELAMELANRQRDVLAAKYAQSIRTKERACAQLQQLKDYLADTDRRWSEGSSTNTTSATNTSTSALRTPELMHNHYQFVGRLEQAAKMQVGVIDNLQLQVTSAHQSLLGAESRLLGLKKVHQSRQTAAQALQHKREQASTDEFAAQRHIRRSAQTQSNGDSYGH